MENYRRLFFAGFVAPRAASENNNNTSAAGGGARSSSNTNDGNAAASSPLSASSIFVDDEHNSLETMALDFFLPYGTIDFFAFDARLGVGYIEFRHGKSGENLYLTAHLMPFRVHFDLEDENNDNDNEDNSNNAPFSLVCLEFACLLPLDFSNDGDGGLPLQNSLYCWAACSRKNLQNFPPPQNQNSRCCKRWRDHLEFQRRQTQQRELFAEQVAKLKARLILTSKAGDDDVLLDAETVFELQLLVERHVESLVDSENVVKTKKSDFWENGVIQKCMTKIVRNFCGVDPNHFAVSPIARRRRREQQQQQNQEEENEEKEDQETTALLSSIVHASISILDVWHCIYETYYSGSDDASRRAHSSPVAVLDFKLRKGAESSLRHPAWASFLVKFPGGAAQRRSLSAASSSRGGGGGGDAAASEADLVTAETVSPVVQRRFEVYRLFNSGYTAADLGLAGGWPGGKDDDVGSALRAVMALLCAQRPLYTDSVLRHLWCDVALRSTKTSGEGKSPHLLAQLEKSEAQLKKIFSNSAGGDSLLEGAWFLLFRAQWRMENAFALVVEFLDEPVAGTLLTDTGLQSEAQAGTASFLQRLQLLDSQPALWPLVRPLQAREVRWTSGGGGDGCGGGVFSDAAAVYERLFDGDEAADEKQNSSSSSSKKNNNKKNNNENEKNEEGNDEPQLSYFSQAARFFWQCWRWFDVIVLLPTLYYALVLFSRPDAGFVRSRHFRRRVLRSFAEMYLLPLVWLVALVAFVIVAERRGWMRWIQEKFLQLF